MMRAKSWLILVLVGIGTASFVSEAQAVVLPEKKWVKRLLPASGEGACPQNCKHMRITPNPVNGRLYFCGGDYNINGDGFLESGRQNVYSYSIETGTWYDEFPYCAPLGQVQPSHPDEVGWVYDTRRNIFWMIPGYMGAAGDADGGLCLNPLSSLIRWEIMTFDAVQKRWTLQLVPELTGVTLGDNGFAQYDPVTDTIIQFYYDSFPGVGIFDIQSSTWTKIRFPGNAHLNKEYTAFDPVNRVIYAIEAEESKLYRYDIDARTLTAVTSVPAGAVSNQTRIAWDTANNILAWAQWGGSTGSDPATFRFFAYRPSTNQWETLEHTLDEDGGPVYGLNFVYDPATNAFLLMGSGDSYPNRPYFFLYRYGNGGPPPPPDTTQPNAITDVRPR